MRIIFKSVAYTAIGFSNSYTGKFLVDGDTYTESDNGEEMTLQLPERWCTVGNELTERKLNF